MLFNKNKTVQEIKNTSENIGAEELDEIIHAVGIIEKTYLERDLENIDITAVEKPVKYSNIFEGTADLVGTIKQKADYYPKEYFGKKIILDWKTKDSAFSDLTKWRKTYMDSWQWRLYSFAEKSSVFEYRGISRATGETKNITLKVREENNENCLDYLNRSQGLITYLSQFKIWPRHKPFACHSYNRECPFYSECKDDKVPHNLQGLIKIKPLHYSDLEVFYMCPERYRLLAKLQEKLELEQMGESESSRYTRFGKAFHRGVAEIYKKAYKL